MWKTPHKFFPGEHTQEKSIKHLLFEAYNYIYILFLCLHFAYIAQEQGSPGSYLGVPLAKVLSTGQTSSATKVPQSLMTTDSAYYFRSIHGSQPN